MYIMSLIRKSGFKDLDFFIRNRSAICKVPKTMIFMDKIDNAILMAKYLHSRLFERIQKEKRLNHIIRIFKVNLTTTSRTSF